MRDPNRWQPLALDQLIAQNGLPIPGKVQRFVGPHWGDVRALRAARVAPRGCRSTPARRPPRRPATDAAFKQTAVEVIRRSSELDPDDGVDDRHRPAAPAATTRSARTTATGTPATRSTGEPYAPNRVLPRRLRARPDRVLGGRARSETPPGHWNTVANEVSDSRPSAAIGGAAAEVDRLEWDVKLYFALNGAVHDAAVAAWGVKAPLRLGAPDLDDPLPGRSGSELPLVPGPRRGRHASRVERARASATRTWPTMSARSPCGPGAATRRIRRRGGGRRLDPRRRLGAVPAADLRHARPSPATSPGTARSAAPPPRC